MHYENVIRNKAIHNDSKNENEENKRENAIFAFSVDIITSLDKIIYGKQKKNMIRMKRNTDR